MRRAMRLRGFVMMEVLVALFLVGLAVSGALSLALGGFGATAEARRAQQATLLASDLAGRIRALPGVDWTALPEPGTCVGGCSPEALAALELLQWRARLEESLPDATGSLAAASTGAIALQLEWTASGGERRALRVDLARGAP